MNTRQGSSAPLRVAKDGSRATPTQTAVTHLAHQVLGRVRLMKACKHDGRRKNRNYHDDLYKNHDLYKKSISLILDYPVQALKFTKESVSLIFRK